MEGNLKSRLIQFINHKGISTRNFEKMCDFGNGFVANAGESMRKPNLEKLSTVFPELNISWLLTGEGEMIKPIQTVGDISNSTVSGVNVSGQEIHIHPNAYDTLLKIVEVNQRTTEKFQEQIDRLISIIEKQYGATGK